MGKLMNINIISHIHSKNYMTRQEAAKEFGVSVRTIDDRVKGIEEEVKLKRYPAHSVIKNGGIKIINYLVLVDYLMYMDRLNEKNLRKHVPPFEPQEVAKGLGWYVEKAE